MSREISRTYMSTIGTNEVVFEKEGTKIYLSTAIEMLIQAVEDSDLCETKLREAHDVSRVLNDAAITLIGKRCSWLKRINGEILV